MAHLDQSEMLITAKLPISYVAKALTFEVNDLWSRKTRVGQP